MQRAASSLHYAGAALKMALLDDINSECDDIFQAGWTRRDGRQVPDPMSLKLGNDGVDISAAVLYADLDGSTKLVNNYSKPFAAEVYKTYLLCAAKIIKSKGGVITSYDGDRVMGIFKSETPCTDAAKAALHINYAVFNVLRPKIRSYKPDFILKHKVGVDYSALMAARIGVRNDNDLVWVGRAANYAAKLTALPDEPPLFITGDVYDRMHESAKFSGNPKKAMWEERAWTDMEDMRVYSSTWSWKP